jgi:hypothetical protein
MVTAVCNRAQTSPKSAELFAFVRIVRIVRIARVARETD